MLSSSALFFEYVINRPHAHWFCRTDEWNKLLSRCKEKYLPARRRKQRPDIFFSRNDGFMVSFVFVAYLTSMSSFSKCVRITIPGSLNFSMVGYGSKRGSLSCFELIQNRGAELIPLNVSTTYPDFFEKFEKRFKPFHANPSWVHRDPYHLYMMDDWNSIEFLTGLV